MPYPFTHILGWSFSRYQTFSSCKRMYYLNYYSKHLPKEEQQKLVHLKSLSSVAMEQGSAIHHLIEVALRKLRKGNPNIDIARLEDYVEAYADTLIKQRQFFDTYYKGIEVRTEDISENVLTKFKVFAESEVFEGLAELVASGQTDVNKWLVESNGDKYGETRIGETKAYCVIDFLFPKGEETIIMDWKTGSASPTHRNQLLGYVLAAQTEFSINPQKTTTKAVYIAENEVEEVAFNPSLEELENYKMEIALQAKEMYGYCADVDKNKPKDISEFEMTPHEKLCSYCNFKEYCGR